MRFSLTDARKKLPELVKSAERGEVVTICRRGVPIVEIVRATRSARKKPKLGTMRGKIKVIDPDWWKPMTDEGVEAFLDGRYQVEQIELLADSELNRIPSKTSRARAPAPH